eukprot:scaffold72074_cov27-Phaeocystis_antarctica.AAC.1
MGRRRAEGGVGGGAAPNSIGWRPRPTAGGTFSARRRGRQTYMTRTTTATATTRPVDMATTRLRELTAASTRRRRRGGASRRLRRHRHLPRNR